VRAAADRSQPLICANRLVAGSRPAVRVIDPIAQIPSLLAVRAFPEEVRAGLVPAESALAQDPACSDGGLGPVQGVDEDQESPTRRAALAAVLPICERRKE